MKSMDETNSISKFHLFQRRVQRIVIYETKSRFYVLGSNDTQTQFRVLKIDRTEPKTLQLLDDGLVYESHEIQDLLRMIDVGNRSKIAGQKIGSGLNKTTSAYGIAGFVRFLEGYYMILITSRRKVATIGYHAIYKIEDTQMIYLPYSEAKDNPAEEARYLKMFQAIDLSSNFYYSYSYDLTHTLQYNMQPPVFLNTKNSKVKIQDLFPNEVPSDLGYLPTPNERFLWNKYLNDPIKGRVHQDWILNVIHGFVDHGNISVYGSSVLLTLIARRSNKFAGTRFLKRGSNFDGDVANEVEIEQIVTETGSSNLSKTKVTAFAQLRGSVPTHWTQDISTMVPKPPIYIELSDPMAITPAKHFNDLMERYGTPVICLNLVKKEKRTKRRKHESILSDELTKSISYLNMFLPASHRIQYLHFDMAKCKKSENNEVMHRLHEIAYRAIGKNGIYHNSRPFEWYKHRQDKYSDLIKSYLNNPCNGDETYQIGVVRTNCVDCLDRTNTAQFVIGKCALGLQLFALGYISQPKIEFESDVARMLEAMYEDLGDTIALQYGGSQLIHRIKSYRKNANHWTSKANDITQTLRRYYSNTLSDADKQMTINLFLGVFRPRSEGPHLWDKEAFVTDTLLHKPTHGERSVYTTHWWNKRLKECLPLPLYYLEKDCQQLLRYNPTYECFDFYSDHYHPFQITYLGENFTYKEVSHTVRDYMPNCCTDFSPFAVRDRQGKRQEETTSLKGKTTLHFLLATVANVTSSASLSSSPTVSSATGTTNSGNTDDDSESESDSDNASDTPPASGEDYDRISFSWSTTAATAQSLDHNEFNTNLCFDILFPTTEASYGWSLSNPDKVDQNLYDKYVSMNGLDDNYDERESPCFLPPQVRSEDLKIYEKNVEIAHSGLECLTASDVDMTAYRNYIDLFA